MTGRTHIRTARLTLRPLERADAQAMTALISEFEVSKWLSVVPYPYSLDDANAFLTSVQDKAGLIWAIEADGAVCGVIGVESEFGYWLGQPYWGQGYITEAGDAVIDAWFAEPTAGDLTCGYFVDNARSGHALEKMGFVDDGPKPIFCVSLNKDMPSRAMRLTRGQWEKRRKFRIETDRLVLRELQDTDWQDLQRLGGVRDVAGMLFSVKAPWPEPDVKLWLARSKFRGRLGFRPAVCLTDGTLTGALGLGKDPGAAHPTCAYFLGQEHWGQGYATEALTAFLADCYDRFDLDVIAADHFTDNPASGRVLKKLGFQKTGKGLGTSAARLEPSPNIAYRLTKAGFQAASGAVQ